MVGMAEKISPVTQRTLDRITEQKEHISKIKQLAKLFDHYERTGYAYVPLSKENFDTIQRALTCHMAAIEVDVARQEEALKNGSEDGDLRSQTEKQILVSCLAMLQNAVDYFGEYLEFIGYTPDPSDEESEFEYSLTFGQIVNQLFMWNTCHSGGTSTAAKCRELGVDYGKSVKFAINHEEDEL